MHFRYLKTGVSVLLVFISFKLLFHNYLEVIGFKNYYSPMFVLATLLLSIVFSLIITEKSRDINNCL